MIESNKEMPMQRNLQFLVGGLTLVLFAQTALATSATRSTAFEYNATTGQLNKEVIEGENSNLCLVTTYTYDGYGNRLSSTTRNCNGSTANEAAAPTGAAVFTARTVSSSYAAGTGYPAGEFTDTNKDALNHTETKTYDPRFGGVSTHKDPNLVLTTQTYDTFGRPSLLTKGDGTKLQMTYSFCSGVNGGTASCPALAAYVVKSQPLASDGVTANGPWTQTYYDILDRGVSQQTLAFDGSSVIVISTAYDTLGHAVSRSRPYFSTGTAELTSFQFDSIDRVTLQTNPDTSTRSVSYSGLQVTTTNELTQSTVVVYNSQGLRIKVNDPAGQQMTFVYDPFGDMVQSRDSVGNVVRAYYDIRGRKTSSSDPDMGTWSYVYDALGELVQQTNANNQTSTVAYDLGSRVSSRADPDLVSNWTYDSCSNGIGKLCSATSNDGYSRTHTYDTLSRPLATTVTADTTYTNSVTYDSNGRVASQTYPGGVTVNLGYTALSFLQTVTDASTSIVYWKETTADAEGHVTGQTYGNGITTTNAYDPQTGRFLTSQAGTSNAIVNLSYTYDYLGNVKTRNDVNQNLTESFPIYDNLNRLKTSTVNSTGAGVVTLTYNYDVLGNMTSRSDVGTYTYGSVGAGPHEVKSISGTVNTSYTYDGDGNMKTGNGRTATYTSFDMPLTITEPGASDAFIYGPEYQRIKRTTGSKITIYVNPNNAGGLAYEKDMTSASATIEDRVYISAGGDPVVLLKRANGTGSFVPYYLHRDPIGSTVAITSGAAAVLERLSYEPFGKRRAPDGASDPTDAIKGVNSDRGFTDHEHLDDMALIHMNGRVFDPLVSRFLSADPNVQSSYDQQSYNRYSYVSNNPLNTRDPTGYFSLFSGIAGLAGLGDPGLTVANIQLHKVTVQYLASHLWAYMIANIAVSAATAEWCGGCGTALLTSDVTYAQTGSYRKAFKAGAIAYATAEATEYLFQGLGSLSQGFAIEPAINSSGAVAGEDASESAGDADLQQITVTAQSQNSISMAPSDGGIDPVVVTASAATSAASQVLATDYNSSDQLSEITVLGNNRGERGWQGNDPNPTKGWRPIRDANGNAIGWGRRNPQTGKKETKSLDWGKQNGLDPSNFAAVPVIPEIAPYVSLPGGVPVGPSASPNFGSVADWAAALNALLLSLEQYAVP